MRTATIGLILATAMAAISARAGYIGVMVDEDTGEVIPASLEARIGAGGGNSGSGFPLTNSANFASNAAYNISSLQLVGSTNVIESDGTNLTYGGLAIAGTGSGFPLTNNGNLAQFSLTNGATIQATSGVFGGLSATTANIGSGSVSGDWNILGNLSVIGYSSNVSWIYVDHRTNVYVGTTTTYVDQVIYSTNVQYLNTIYYTNTINTITNWVDTFVSVGGTWNASNAAWVSIPNLYLAGTNATASGQWDFADATLLGLPSQGITNIGGGLTGDGLTNALAVDWMAGTTNNMTGIPWGDLVGIQSETDPVWTSYLATTLTNTLDARVSAIAVTGAVTSINNFDGVVTLEAGDNVNITTNLGTKTLTLTAGSGPFRTYESLTPNVGGTALVTAANARWLRITEGEGDEVSLDVDTASFAAHADDGIQFQIEWRRGTNETYEVITNNIDNSTFVDCPASTTNHLFLERRPGWPRFQIWQDFR